MHWFQANASIRLKMMVVVLSFATLVMASGVTAVAVGGTGGLLATLAFAAAALGLGLWYRHAICLPYVTTVVRMEALASGDLETPIQFKDYRDCVGRMTAAMLTFRDTALQQRTHAAEQNEVVTTVGEKLQAVAAGDLTVEINTEFRGLYAQLKTDFNAAVEALRDLIASVTRSARDIGTGSSEIAQASEDLARRTESNAASLEQTAAAISRYGDGGEAELVFAEV
jgi:methyl-accepting chemotaxis protein